MALGRFQTTSLTNAGTLLSGGFKMGYAATAGSFVGTVGTALGIGNLTGFTENIEMTTTQAGNSNMPIEQVAVHTVTVSFDLLELWPTSFDAIRGGSLDTVNAGTDGTYTTGTANTNVISTGGLTTIDTAAFCFQNTTYVATVAKKTYLVIYKARIESGMVWAPKTDHDTDPVMVYPFTITGEVDTSRTAGDQLFVIETELGV